MSELLTPNQVAKLLGVAVETLNVWRATNRYKLPYIKVGRLVRYRLADIEKFIEENTITKCEGLPHAS